MLTIVMYGYRAYDYFCKYTRLALDSNNSHKWNLQKKMSLCGMLNSCGDIYNISLSSPHQITIHGVVDQVQCFTQTVCGNFWDGQHYYVSYMMNWHITIASSRHLWVPNKRCMYTYQVSQSVSGLQYTHIVHAGCKMKLTIKSMHTLCPDVTPIPQFFR